MLLTMNGGDRENQSINHDRISELPEEIIHKILSSMNIKYAVQTCVLSKRWRNVWTSLNSLRFCYLEFPFPFPVDSYDSKDKRPDIPFPEGYESHCSEANMRWFENFVEWVLDNRDNSTLCTFHLAYYGTEPSLVRKCLSYAVSHKAQELCVWAPLVSQPFEFPPCFINSGTLKQLRLAFFDSMPLDIPLQLSALKTLHLSRFPDRSAKFVSETVGSCPNLETLILDQFEQKKFIITAPRLKMLKLSYGRLYSSESYDSEIVVLASGLTSLKLEGVVSPVFSVDSLPCLDNVYIHLDPDSEFFDEGHPLSDENVKQRMPLNVIKMLGHLREAKSVTLSLSTLKVLAMDSDSLKSHPSPFYKLKHLSLTIPESFSTLTLPFYKFKHLSLTIPGSFSTLPLNVITYLTQGSSCGDTMVISFPQVLTDSCD